MSSQTRAIIAELYKVEGKAELVHGEIARMLRSMPGCTGNMRALSD